MSNGKIIHHLPHFATSQSKFRVVYHASSKFHGTSLNDALYHAPDLMSPLINVLLRFHEKAIGILADIRKMYYMVKLDPNDQDAVRVLWFNNGN